MTIDISLIFFFFKKYKIWCNRIKDDRHSNKRDGSTGSDLKNTWDWEVLFTRTAEAETVNTQEMFLFIH